MNREEGEPMGSSERPGGLEDMELWELKWEEDVLGKFPRGM